MCSSVKSTVTFVKAFCVNHKAQLKSQLLITVGVPTPTIVQDTGGLGVGLGADCPRGHKDDESFLQVVRTAPRSLLGPLCPLSWERSQGVVLP